MNKLTAKSVTLADAQQRIKQWREYVGEEFETKAFFIPLDDLKALAEEMYAIQCTGLRAYLARSESDGKMQNELLIVGVQDNGTNEDGTDIIAAGDNSAIYDFTTPCPRMCDSNSKLVTLIPPTL